MFCASACLALLATALVPPDVSAVRDSFGATGATGALSKPEPPPQPSEHGGGDRAGAPEPLSELEITAGIGGEETRARVGGDQRGAASRATTREFEKDQRVMAVDDLNTWASGMLTGAVLIPKGAQGTIIGVLEKDFDDTGKTRKVVEVKWDQVTTHGRGFKGLMTQVHVSSMPNLQVIQ